MPLIIKVELHNTMPLKLLLLGGENWSRNAAVINKYEVYYHKATRRILKISMMRVKEDRIRNKTIRKYF